MADFGKRKDGPNGKRAAPRAPILLRAALHTLTSSRAITLFDVSCTGARMSMPEPLSVGQELWLKIPPLEIFANVVWTEDAMCGIRFDEPLWEVEVVILRSKGKIVMVHGLSPDELLGSEDWSTNLAR